MMMLVIGLALLAVFIFGCGVGSYLRDFIVKKTIKASVKEACDQATRELLRQVVTARRDLSNVLAEARVQLLRCAYTSRRSVEIDWDTFYSVNRDSGRLDLDRD